MKTFYCPSLLVFTLIHAACGTEVGNGRQGGQQPKPTSEKAASEPASGTSPDSLENVDTGEESNSTILIAGSQDWLFASCASPLAEITAGSFVSSTGTTLVVTSQSATQRSAYFQGALYTYSPQATAAQPYAILATPLAYPYSCGLVSSSVQADGTIERSVLLQGRHVLRWKIKAQIVQSIDWEDWESKKILSLSRVNGGS